MTSLALFAIRARGERMMTKEEAKNLATFENECTCGGFAWQMNGRPQEQPHMNWCPQYDEYEEWYQALHGDDAARARDEAATDI